jgi:hypothetical protein
MMPAEEYFEGEEVPAEPEVIEHSARKVKTPLKTTRTK